MKRFFQLTMTIIVAAIVAVACQKPEPKIDYKKLAEDSVLAQKLFDDVFKVLDEEAKNGDYSADLNGKTTIIRSSVSDTCAIVTLNVTSGFPMTLTIDFGSGCIATSTVNGGTITRKGILTAVFSGSYDQAGSTITITESNYYVNDHKVEGVIVITNSGRNSSGNLEFAVSNQNGRIIKPDNGVVTWRSERVHEWIEGEGTNFLTHGVPGICDDVYLIYGYGEGEICDGTEYRIEATAPLRKETCCRWVTNGILTYFVNGSELGSIDYAQTTCTSPFAVLNYGDQSIIIVIQ
jgi:hypothetical protein